ncbi:MAG: hypothetical protein JWP91_4186 [Fibrobacteres bacterium]|nr:hypothetical protein [Fibrobacterota bacterium]
MIRLFSRAWLLSAALAVLSGPFWPGAASMASADITVVPFFPSGEVPLDKPVWFGEMPGRPGTFVILERFEGRIALATLTEGKWVKSEFLKVAVKTEGEMGLLGIAFHPDFANNRKYYLDYNPASGGFATLIEEREADSSFTRDSGKPPRRIMRIDQGKQLNHKGGTIAFGPKDGFLYVGMGDGGESLNAQNTATLLGKFLRVDVNAPDSFQVPEDNPFVGRAGTRPEIWALGVRNPWKWSFDPVTGELWAGDVGETAREEIDRIGRGQNLGWPFREGTICQEPDSCDKAGLVGPLAELGRALASTIIGGVVYRGNPASPLYGQYFFADFATGTLWRMTPPPEGETGTFQRVLDLGWGPTSFGTDLLGNIYLTRYETGAIYRLEGADILGLAESRARKNAWEGPRVMRIRRGQSWGNAFPGERSAVEVFSPEGRKVSGFNAGGPDAVVALPEGVYFLQGKGSGFGPARLLLVE